jgi:predicted aspartyl protease
LGRPVIEGSINGVRGEFLIDTGANEPVLTMKAVRQCGLPLSSGTRSEAFLGDDRPKQFRIVKGNVTIEIDGAAISLGNPSVVSGLGSENWFGLIDYHTLKACHAVINVKEKSFTISP